MAISCQPSAVSRQLSASAPLILSAPRSGVSEGSVNDLVVQHRDLGSVLEADPGFADFPVPLLVLLGDRAHDRAGLPVVNLAVPGSEHLLVGVASDGLVGDGGHVFAILLDCQRPAPARCEASSPKPGTETG